MWLLVDIGNTNLKWATLEGGQLRPGGASPHGGGLPEAVTSPWLSAPVPAGVWVANVAGAGPGAELSAWCRAHWGQSPRVAVAQRQLLGVRNGYRDCTRLGVDRWLALVAAYTTQQKAVLVVDCGTAATLDLVSDHGQHLGGLILPGQRMMRHALVAGTRLSPPPSPGDTLSLGDDTASCIHSGIRCALIGAVERTLHHAASVLGHPPELVLTGGDGAFIHPFLTGRLEPDLVLQGLALHAQAQ